MATKIRKHSSQKRIVRAKRKTRIRSVLEGTSERPRLVIFKSNTNIYAQVIDDNKGQTLVSASTLEKDLKDKFSANLTGAKAIGQLVAKRALEKKISLVVFDRAGYIYHGKVKALADAAREAGLKF